MTMSRNELLDYLNDRFWAAAHFRTQLIDIGANDPEVMKIREEVMHDMAAFNLSCDIVGMC